MAIKQSKYSVAMVGEGYKILSDAITPNPHLDIVLLAAAKRAVETGETYGVFDETGLLVFKIEAGEQWRKSDTDKLQKTLLHF